MEVRTFAELSTMIYFSINAEKYMNADESEFKLFNLDTELCYLRVDNTVVFVFKGSCTMTDWLYNLQFWKCPFAYGDFRIHQGMNSKIKVTYDYIKSKLKPNDKVYLTGHSLGGALSLLTAYALRTELGTDIAGVPVFGAPRVGGGPWKDAYNNLLYDKTFSYQNEGDFVPSLPPRLFGYTNVGQHVKLYGKKKVFPSSVHLPWFYVVNLG